MKLSKFLRQFIILFFSYSKDFIFFPREKSKSKVSFMAGSLNFYNQIMASTRIRVYDVISFFKNDKKYYLNLYNPLLNYKAVIFQKYFNKEARKKAKKIKNKKGKIVLDINVNYLDDSSKYINKEQSDNIKKFIKLCDHIITSSSHLKRVIESHYPQKRVTTIEEAISDKYFKTKKQNFNKEIKFVWSGYFTKAQDLLLIQDILLDLYKRFKFEILIITNKNPEIKIGEIPIKYIKYQEDKIVSQLLEGDIFLSPRDLDDPYNWGHTFTKVGVPMSLGLPVIASPIPSYESSPAILCSGQEDWKKNLENILSGKINLENLSKKGINYCWNNYRKEKIKEDYKKFFDSL